MKNEAAHAVIYGLFGLSSQRSNLPPNSGAPLSVRSGGASFFR